MWVIFRECGEWQGISSKVEGGCLYELCKASNTICK